MITEQSHRTVSHQGGTGQCPLSVLQRIIAHIAFRFEVAGPLASHRVTILGSETTTYGG
jgi:hypothetical protein